MIVNNQTSKITASKSAAAGHSRSRLRVGAASRSPVISKALPGNLSCRGPCWVANSPRLSVAGSRAAGFGGPFVRDAHADIVRPSSPGARPTHANGAERPGAEPGADEARDRTDDRPLLLPSHFAA